MKSIQFECLLLGHDDWPWLHHGLQGRRCKRCGHWTKIDLWPSLKSLSFPLIIASITYAFIVVFCFLGGVLSIIL